MNATEDALLDVIEATVAAGGLTLEEAAELPADELRERFPSLQPRMIELLRSQADAAFE